MMAFCPEHPKWDQNPKLTPLSETTSIPTPFICGVSPLATEALQRQAFLEDLRFTKWKPKSRNDKVETSENQTIFLHATNKTVFNLKFGYGLCSPPSVCYLS